MDDQRTLYFKLDRDARFSDGKPVTARDYVFTWQMMQLASTSSTRSTTTTPSSTTSRSTPSTTTRCASSARGRAGGRCPTTPACCRRRRTPPCSTTTGSSAPPTSRRWPSGPTWSQGHRARRIGHLRSVCRTGGATASATSSGLYNFDRIHLRVIPTERRPGLPAPRRTRPGGGHLGAHLERGLQLPGRAQRLAAARPRHGRHGPGRVRPAHEPGGADLPEQGLPQGDAVPVQFRAR